MVVTDDLNHSYRSSKSEQCGKSGLVTKNKGCHKKRHVLNFDGLWKIHQKILAWVRPHPPFLAMPGF